ncbi:MAG: type II toxin-antitoxin system Phd/YefM family antitoxin [Desulfovibrionaceae bacterium]|nr:type II toxin-antitoxin system Phd/YefM family antitoxin [Desulfovibrionaceae bacterium]MBF0515232.1 type II toxin-antitoxin system Phd/YefM family antitoxin [Desulfovibrionaceae bacterium]
MKLSESVKPISYVKAHAAEVIRRIGEDGRPVVITQNGEAKAVLLDVREYDGLRESLALLKILAQGAQEVEEGKIKPAREVFADLRADMAIFPAKAAETAGLKTRP